MKLAARIMILIWTLTLVQPAFAYFGGKSAYGKCSITVTQKTTCSKTKSTVSACKKKNINKAVCSKKKCNKTDKSEGKDNCKSEGCNPTLGCSSGNFYVHHQHQITIASSFGQKKKEIVTNDNRVIGNLSECWHPPES